MNYKTRLVDKSGGFLSLSTDHIIHIIKQHRSLWDVSYNNNLNILDEWKLVVQELVEGLESYSNDDQLYLIEKTIEIWKLLKYNYERQLLNPIEGQYNKFMYFDQLQFLSMDNQDLIRSTITPGSVMECEDVKSEDPMILWPASATQEELLSRDPLATPCLNEDAIEDNSTYNALTNLHQYVNCMDPYKPQETNIPQRINIIPDAAIFNATSSSPSTSSVSSTSTHDLLTTKAVKKRGFSVDSITIITAVQKRECLWNTHCTDYYDGRKVYNSWRSIGEDLVDNFASLSDSKRNSIVRKLKVTWAKLIEMLRNGTLKAEYEELMRFVPMEKESIDTSEQLFVSAAGIDVDPKRLIKSVQKHVLLWDTRHEPSLNAWIRAKEWKLVAQEVINDFKTDSFEEQQSTVEKIQLMWAELKHAFDDQLNTGNTTTYSFPYFSCMQFLTTPAPDTSLLQPTNASNNPYSLDILPSTSSVSQASGSPSTMQAAIPEDQLMSAAYPNNASADHVQDLTLTNDSFNDNNDTIQDHTFCATLAPEISKIHPSNKNLFKSDLFQLINLYQNRIQLT